MVMDDWDDQQLISTVLDGDKEAYATLFGRYQRTIYSLMLRTTRSHEDALDLSQDTFLKAFEHLHRFKAGRRFFPWLYTIGINHARNFVEKRKTSESCPLEEWDHGADTRPGEEEEKVCDSIDSRRLGGALAELSIDYREALMLRYHKECSMQDIALALNTSVSGAKMRVHRGLRQLRQILERGELETGAEKPRRYERTPGHRTSIPNPATLPTEDRLFL